MKRASAVVAVAVLILIAFLLHSPIKDFLWQHPWWHSFLVAIPAIVLAVVAFFEHRRASKTDDLQLQIAKLTTDLGAERNKHLQQIASKMGRPPTPAERNATKLRQHIGASVPVTQGGNSCGSLQIVEVNEDNIATLFRPHGYASSTAWCRQADCGEMQIVDIPQGSSPLQLTVLEWYGTPVELGEITKWEDRSEAVANPPFQKGGLAYQATYTKAGSSAARSMYVYMRQDGANSFLLESSTGTPITGNNEEISKQFMVRQIEYQAAGFERRTSGTAGNNPHRLFIC